MSHLLKYDCSFCCTQTHTPAAWPPMAPRSLLLSKTACHHSRMRRKNNPSVFNKRSEFGSLSITFLRITLYGCFYVTLAEHVDLDSMFVQTIMCFRLTKKKLHFFRSPFKCWKQKQKKTTSIRTHTQPFAGIAAKEYSHPIQFIRASHSTFISSCRTLYEVAVEYKEHIPVIIEKFKETIFHRRVRALANTDRFQQNINDVIEPSHHAQMAEKEKAPTHSDRAPVHYHHVNVSAVCECVFTV